MGTVAPERILRELADLWVSEGQAEGGSGVLRACSMTLVVVSEAAEDAGLLGETIAALMPEHPARTVLLRLTGAGSASLEDRVYAQCWMPFGQRRQICCEQVEIRVSDSALLDVPPVVLPLAVADLPLILWCRSPRLTALPEFDALAAMARKVIVDSAAFPDGLARVRRISTGNRFLGDLAWTRVTRWREMLSQLFENRENLGMLSRISRVTVEYPGPAPTTTSLYMGAWVMDCLEDAGLKPELTLTPGKWSGRAEAPLVIRVLLEGANTTVELARWENRMVTTINGLAQCVNLPLVTEYALVREELGLVRRDAVFDRTLASASKLAYANDR